MLMPPFYSLPPLNTTLSIGLSALRGSPSRVTRLAVPYGIFSLHQHKNASYASEMRHSTGRSWSVRRRGSVTPWQQS